jgi:hypothetical protein
MIDMASTLVIIAEFATSPMVCFPAAFHRGICSSRNGRFPATFV